ncbi:MAG: M20 family metallopeptidase [Chloroflexi bacterium]|nr:M20 family metallopeptidase [Chloroflexota bacterium]
MVRDWEALVSIESGSLEPENVNRAAQWVHDQFSSLGFDCRFIDASPNGKGVVGLVNGEVDAEPVVFSGHFDTVFKQGTLENNPFRIEDGKVYGPGALDMKGGIVISLYVVKCLLENGYKERPLKILYVGDEEIGHAKANTAQLMMEEAKGAFCAFNMETGLPTGNLCIGRKGRIGIVIGVDGVEAHSGNDFEKGVCAIEEAAYKILEFRKLTNLETGTTASTNVIRGGTVSNVIAGRCEFEVDIRFARVDAKDFIDKEIERIVKTSYAPGSKAELVSYNVMDAYETTDDVRTFMAFCARISKEYGFGEIEGLQLGGSSDASYVTIAGTPIICSFGVQGQWNHTPREYAILETLFKRAKFIVTIIANLNQLSF